ncbi:fucose mutarotase isoform X1 [Equus asinus]|uniref:fucose mutarotase isoform X1 n=1 Tax=Equus asinus TaxID=9793 RepID=UPI0038F5DA57
MVVLKGVPALLSPELLFALARMGHGDEIVLADVNFPTSSICRCGPEEIRADGLGIPQLLEAVLKLLPLDTYVESPAAVMELEPSDWERGLQTPVWRSYESILFMAGCTSTLAKIERFEFYERAKKAFAVVATGDQGQENTQCPGGGPARRGACKAATASRHEAWTALTGEGFPPASVSDPKVSLRASPPPLQTFLRTHGCRSWGDRGSQPLDPSGPGGGVPDIKDPAGQTSPPRGHLGLSLGKQPYSGPVTARVLPQTLTPWPFLATRRPFFKQLC